MTDTDRNHYLLTTDHVLHVYEGVGTWLVWLNANEVDFSGVLIGSGVTRGEAVDEAVATLGEAQARLIKER